MNIKTWTNRFHLQGIEFWDTKEVVLKLFLAVSLVYLLKTTQTLFIPAFLLTLFFTYSILGKGVTLISPLIWITLAIFHLLEIIYDPFRPANHQYLLLYMSILLIVVLLFDETEQEEVLVKNSNYLIIALMLFAGIHKLLSPQIWDGSYYTMLFLRGEMFKPITLFIEPLKEIFAFNNELITSFHSTKPSFDSGVVLSSPNKDLAIIGKYFSYGVVAGELSIPIIFLLVKNPYIKHFALLAITLGVFSSRLECGFLSLICILGFASCPAQLLGIRSTYFLMFILFLSLVSLDLAYV